jgi:hypothetical protein
VSVKQKLKSFFKASEASDSAVELLRMYILPFSKKVKGRGVSVDDVLSFFFALEDRSFVTVEAREKFKMPGRMSITGARAEYGIGPRAIVKGQRMLMAMDKKENRTRIETKINGKFYQFVLENFELKTIQDYLEEVRK